MAVLSYKSGKRISKKMAIVKGASVHLSGNIYFQVFPNPAHQILNVLTDEEIEEISVMDLIGKEIFKQKGNINKEIPLQNFPGGVYLLKIKTSTGIGIQKFMKE